MNACSSFANMLSNSSGFLDFICKQYMMFLDGSSIVEVDLGSDTIPFLFTTVSFHGWVCH